MLVLRGDLIHGSADTLTNALARLPDGTGRVDLDLTGVAFMDTTGLRFLEVLDTYGRRRRVRVSATGWNDQPRRVLEMAGLDPDDPLHGPKTHREPVPSAVVLERAEQLDLLRTEVEQLRRAIVSRPVIDQARGVLMATHACSSTRRGTSCGRPPSSPTPSCARSRRWSRQRPGAVARCRRRSCGRRCGRRSTVA